MKVDNSNKQQQQEQSIDNEQEEWNAMREDLHV